jgi:hypothetical protein
MFHVKGGKMVEAMPVAFHDGQPTQVWRGCVHDPAAFRGVCPMGVCDTKDYRSPRGDFEDAREKTRKISTDSPNCDRLIAQNDKKIRKFDTGATRDTDTGKYDYEAFFSPTVLERRAAFMHKNRVQKDGTLRDGDNWQKGIPLDTYAKSEFRHHMEFWQLHRGLPAIDNLGNPVDIEDAICAMMFNLEGYLHEYLKNKKAR